MSKKIQYRNLKFHIVKIAIGIYFLFFGISTRAQCAMCRAALESKDNTVQAEAVNDGIVFLMVMPYILVALVGFAVYKLKYSKK
jgi:threonine/homoserine/homoserine lactone efflux protein